MEPSEAELARLAMDESRTWQRRALIAAQYAVKRAAAMVDTVQAMRALARIEVDVDDLAAIRAAQRRIGAEVRELVKNIKGVEVPRGWETVVLFKTLVDLTAPAGGGGVVPLVIKWSAANASPEVYV